MLALVGSGSYSRVMEHNAATEGKEMAATVIALNRPTEDMGRAAVIERIRKALRARSGQSWSVTGGTGTAYGWIRIHAMPKRCIWRVVEPGIELGDRKPGHGHMGVDDREELASLLGLERVHAQGVSIPASNAYYREYIDRAEGREPRTLGTPYWD